MATNAKDKDDKVDDPIATPVTEEDLKNDFDKAEVETTKVADETTDEIDNKESEASEEDGQTDDQATFVKQVPSIAGETEEEYLKNLETAYQASTTEALRLKALTEADKGEDPEEDTGPVDPRLLYLDRMLNKDIQANFEEFKKEYPQVNDPVEYAKFTEEAQSLSAYYQSKKQMLTADELYPKVASILGWERDGTDSREKLGVALKDKAATSKTTSSTPAPTTKPKITEDEMQMNRLMYPDKTDTEIREELETIHSSLKK